jgi:hypothetical protein
MEDMTTDDPFGPDGPLHEFFKRQREQQELIRRALGPSYELQQKMKAMQDVIPAFTKLQQSGVLANIAALENSGTLSSLQAVTKLHSDRFKALAALATPAWMIALQKTAIGIDRDRVGILGTQKLLAASTVPDVLKFARTLSINEASIPALMAASRWTDRFRTLGQSFAGNLDGIRLAAKRAQFIDMATLRASADRVAMSSTMIAAEQVLEAHRLIEAIGQADTPEQSATLFAAFVSIMGALFQTFGENTVKELRGIGAIKLIELFMVAVAIFQFAVPGDLSPAEKKVHAEMQAEIETLQEKIDQILAANAAAEDAYVDGLPRGELKREAALRRDPQGRAAVLMRGDKGLELAIKENRGKWRLVVYRDTLTDQLSEGWVYAAAILVHDTSV